MKGASKPALAIVSTFLFLAVSALWLRGLFIQDKIQFVCFGHFCILSSFPHHLNLIVQHDRYGSESHFQWDTDNAIRAHSRYLEAGFVSYHPITEFWLPHWLVLLFLSIAPIHWLLEPQMRQRRKKGFCPVCGYDLRATPERCPECGTLVKPKLSRPPLAPSRPA